MTLLRLFWGQRRLDYYCFSGVCVCFSCHITVKSTWNNWDIKTFFPFGSDMRFSTLFVNLSTLVYHIQAFDISGVTQMLKIKDLCLDLCQGPLIYKCNLWNKTRFVHVQILSVHVCVKHVCKCKQPFSFILSLKQIHNIQIAIYHVFLWHYILLKVFHIGINDCYLQ